MKEKRKKGKNYGTLSFLLALNFFRHSTVSCLCIQDATVERCCEEEHKRHHQHHHHDNQLFTLFVSGLSQRSRGV